MKKKACQVEPKGVPYEIYATDSEQQGTQSGSVHSVGAVFFNL